MEARAAEHLFLTHRLVAVLRLDSVAEAVTAAGAVIAGGACIIEVTLTIPGALAALAAVRELAPAGVAVGVGTVLEPRDLEAAVAAGAAFAISPDVNPEVMRAARELNLLHVPGALTPTELAAAARAGARLVKLFPLASVGGAGHLRSLRGPFPDLPLLVSGGVDLDSLDDVLAAGADVVGLSNTLVVPELLRAGAVDRIAELTAAYLDRLRLLPHRRARRPGREAQAELGRGTETVQ